MPEAEVAWAVAEGGSVRGDGSDRVVAAASTIKVAIAVRYWREALLEGRLDPAAPAGDLELTGDGALLDYLPGLRPTQAHCATLMLAVSDNAATNVILDAVGLEAVEEECRALGMTATRIRRRMADWRAQDEGRENLTTAGDLARMMAALAEPRLVPTRVAARVLTDLAASQHLDVLGEVCAEAGLEAYPKMGTLPTVFHDCALVRGGGRTRGVAVCSSPPARADSLRAAARRALGLERRGLAC